jgi:hypothetical protein
VWRYDDVVPTTVRVVMLDYDFWYLLAEADGDLAPGDAPNLNEENRLFYVWHRPGWSAPGRRFWPVSPGFRTLAEAVAAAEAVAPSPIAWR